MSRLRITISGEAGSGRSHALAIVVKALRDAGYEIGATIDCVSCAETNRLIIEQPFEGVIVERPA